MTMTVDEQIGAEVHAILWRRRLTQRAVADAAGVDRSTFARKLRGTRGWSSDDLVRVAGVLGVAFEVTPAGCAIRDLNPEPADYLTDQPLAPVYAMRLPISAPELSPAA